jgi:hypothetical protein
MAVDEEQEEKLRGKIRRRKAHTEKLLPLVR